MSKIFIVRAKRTPQGNFLGGLSKYSALDLALKAGEAALKGIDLKKTKYEISEGEIESQLFMIQKTMAKKETVQEKRRRLSELRGKDQCPEYLERGFAHN